MRRAGAVPLAAPAEMDPDRIVRFLIDDPLSPRTVRFALGELARALAALATTVPDHRPSSFAGIDVEPRLLHDGDPKGSPYEFPYDFAQDFRPPAARQRHRDGMPSAPPRGSRTFIDQPRMPAPAA